MDYLGKRIRNASDVGNDFSDVAGQLTVTMMNAVIIRRTMQQLKGAGLIEVKRGTGGMAIARPMEEITLLDIFNAVEPLENGQLFHFHENPNTACPVGRNIHAGLDDKLFSIQSAMEDRMKQITLADVVRDAQSYIAKEPKQA